MNVLESSPSELQSIDRPQSKALKESIDNLVWAKYILDSVIQDRGAAALASKLFPNAGGSMSGHAFFYEVFPFAARLNITRDDFSALVPIESTFGGSWRWRRQYKSPDERVQLRAFFTDPERAQPAPGGHERAEIFWIRQLGLFIPHEGKNRIDFLREENVEFVPALVSPCDYHSPEQLTLYKMDVAGKEEVWAVLDDLWLHRVPYPSLTIPVLRAYGCKTNAAWPESFPAIANVVSEFEDLRRRPTEQGTIVVELEQVRKRQDKGESIIAVSVADLHFLRFRSRKGPWICGVLLALVCITLAFLGSNFSLRDDGLVLLGAIFGLLCSLPVVYFKPLFSAPRKFAELRRDLVDTGDSS